MVTCQDSYSPPPQIGTCHGHMWGQLLSVRCIVTASTQQNENCSFDKDFALCILVSYPDGKIGGKNRLGTIAQVPRPYGVDIWYVG